MREWDIPEVSERSGDWSVEEGEAQQERDLRASTGRPTPDFTKAELEALMDACTNRFDQLAALERATEMPIDMRPKFRQRRDILGKAWSKVERRLEELRVAQ